MKEVKTMNKMSKATVTSCPIVLKSLTWTMYKIDDETAVTLYNFPMPRAEIEHEKHNAMETMKLDIPTLISFNVVQVDEEYGIILEHFKYTHMSQLLREDPDHFDRYVEDFTALAHLMHRTHVAPGIFRPVTDMFAPYLDEVEQRGIFTAEEVAAARRMMDAIPERDTYVHMGYHPIFVLCGGDETVVTNMLVASTGHPIFDLGATALSTIMIAQNFGDAETMIASNMDRATCIRFFKAYIRQYFRCQSEAEAEALEQLIAFASLLKYMVVPAIDHDLTEDYINSVQTQCRQRFFPGIDSWITAMEPLWARFE